MVRKLTASRDSPVALVVAKLRRCFTMTKLRVASWAARSTSSACSEAATRSCISAKARAMHRDRQGGISSADTVPDRKMAHTGQGMPEFTSLCAQICAGRRGASRAMVRRESIASISNANCAGVSNTPPRPAVAIRIGAAPGARRTAISMTSC